MSETDTELLKTVEAVFQNKYIIPEYQRGYKWTAETVTQLLNDIHNFTPKEANFYCLQNITVIKGNDAYEVIDGQQRLTTLAILLAYLGKGEEWGLAHRLEYAIREESGDFLREYILKNQKADSFYDSDKNAFNSTFSEKYGNYDRQDVFYFVQAAYAIDNWFKDKSKEEFIKKLNHVKLIVNTVKGEGAENKIFSNLNANKVPLTPVDLIRAILITRSASPNEDPVALNEQRVRLGWELDLFQQWWQGDASLLFSQFLKKGKDEESKELKNINGIETLYRLYYNRKDEDEKRGGPEWLSIGEIQQKVENDANISDGYQDLRRFHHAMQDWFEDNTIYHYLGFLAFHGSLTIKDLWQEWKGTSSRKDFIKYLKGQINETLFNTLNDENKPKNASSQEKLEYLCTFLDEGDNLYGDKKRFLAAVLVLMDVIELTSKDEKSVGEKEIRRLPVNFFRNNNEDIEHIFCQTPNPKDLEKFKKENLCAFKAKLYDIDKDNILKEQIDNFKGETIEEYQNLLANFKILHKVGNLLLLNSNTNRSYGNDEYLKKRERIIKEHQEGAYIRPHTLTVFTKSFGGSNNLNIWGFEDIENNSRYIKGSIETFIKEALNG